MAVVRLSVLSLMSLTQFACNRQDQREVEQQVFCVCVCVSAGEQRVQGSTLHMPAVRSTSSHTDLSHIQ